MTRESTIGFPLHDIVRRCAGAIAGPCVLAFCSLTGRAQEAAKPPDGNAAKAGLSIVMVGNSFSHNSQEYLRDLAGKSGKRVTIALAAGAGFGFWHHVRAAQAFQEFERTGIPMKSKFGDKPVRNIKEWIDIRDGRTSGSETKSMQEVLRETQPGMVVIHNFSGYTTYDRFMPLAGELVEIIRAEAPNAEIVILKTWAYREDCSFYRDGPEYFTARNQSEMYSALTECYDRLAKDLGGLRQIPIGDAIQNCRELPGWRLAAPVLDPKTGEVVERPREVRSDNDGWKLVGGNHPATDYKHLGTPGKYLAACVFYEWLFGESVLENPFVPKGLDVEDAAFLRRMAHRTVSEGLRPQKPTGTTTIPPESRTSP